MGKVAKVNKRKVPTWAKIAAVGVFGTITLGVATLFYLIYVGIAES